MHVLLHELTNIVYTGEFTLHMRCIQYLHFTRRTFYFILHWGSPEPPTYPSFNCAMSTSPPQKHLGGPPPLSSTHQKAAIHLRARWQEVGHFHMELKQIVLLLRSLTLPLYLALCPLPRHCLKWGWEQIQIPQLNHTAKQLCNSDTPPPRQ